MSFPARPRHGTILPELERVCNHIGDIGAIATTSAFGGQRACRPAEMVRA
jgi:hypothetical protein